MPDRCPWSGNDPLMISYHDEEWGLPLRDDDGLFELLILETFQAGLSWRTILHKRENFRRAFLHFDYRRIAAWGENEVAVLMQDPGIIRNRLKIRAAVANAQAFLQTREEFGSFSAYIWQFVQDKPLQRHPAASSEIPATSPVSDLMSAALKKRGFKFVGSTVCSAFMQAAGLVNDHLQGCFRAMKLS